MVTFLLGTAGFVAGAWASAGIISMDVARIMFLAAFILITLGAFVIEWLSARSRKRIIVSTALAAVLAALLLFGVVYPWTVKKKNEQDMVQDQIFKIDKPGPPTSPPVTATVSSSPSPIVVVRTVPTVTRDLETQEPTPPTNPQKSTPEPERSPIPTESISVSEEEFDTGLEDRRHGLRVIISTTVPIRPVHMMLVCSGPMMSASVRFKPPLVAGVVISNMSALGSLLIQDSYEFSFKDPPLTPGHPLEVQLMSTTQVHVLELKLK